MTAKSRVVVCGSVWCILSAMQRDELQGGDMKDSSMRQAVGSLALAAGERVLFKLRIYKMEVFAGSVPSFAIHLHVSWCMCIISRVAEVAISGRRCLSYLATCTRWLHRGQISLLSQALNGAHTA